MLHLDIDKGNSGQPLREDLNDFNSGSPVTTLVQKLHKLDFVHHVRTGVQQPHRWYQSGKTYNVGGV